MKRGRFKELLSIVRPVGAAEQMLQRNEPMGLIRNTTLHLIKYAKPKIHAKTKVPRIKHTNHQNRNTLFSTKPNR